MRKKFKKNCKKQGKKQSFFPTYHVGATQGSHKNEGRICDTSNGGLEYQNQDEFDTLGHKKPQKSIKKPSDVIRIVLKKD